MQIIESEYLAHVLQQVSAVLVLRIGRKTASNASYLRGHTHRTSQATLTKRGVDNDLYVVHIHPPVTVQIVNGRCRTERLVYHLLDVRYTYGRIAGYGA